MPFRQVQTFVARHKPENSDFGVCLIRCSFEGAAMSRPANPVENNTQQVNVGAVVGEPLYYGGG